MSRRLSNPEWLAFQNQINVEGLGLPPWGGVVEWNGQLVLVFVCPDSRSYLCRWLSVNCPSAGGLCQPGEVMLTDVTDHAELLKNTPRTYDVNSGSWWYHIPEELMGRFYEVAKTTLETTGQIIQAVAQAAGQAAGGLTAPLLGNIAPILIVGVVLFLFMESKR